MAATTGTLLSAKAAADYLGIDVRNIKAMVETGDMPYVMLPSFTKPRFWIVDLDKWIKAHTRVGV